MTSDLGKE